MVAAVGCWPKPHCLLLTIPLLVTQEAVLNLYIGKLKPLLTTDKWMPPAVSKE